MPEQDIEKYACVSLMGNMRYFHCCDQNVDLYLTLFLIPPHYRMKVKQTKRVWCGQ